MFRGPLRIPRLLRNAVRTCSSAISGHRTTTRPRSRSACRRRSNATATSRRRSTHSDGRSPSTIRRPASRSRQHHSARPHQPASGGAARLLPAAELPRPSGYNYQAPILSATRQDSVQSRVTQVVNQRNQIFGTGIVRSGAPSTRRRCSGSTMQTQIANTDVAVNWNRRFSQFMQLRTRYQFTQQSTTVTPFFANRDQRVRRGRHHAATTRSPINWGRRRCRSRASPDSPTDCRDNRRDDARGRRRRPFCSAAGTTSPSAATSAVIDRHRLSQQDPRGAFTFTGAATGFDFADFLLGMPTTSVDRVRQRRQVLPRLLVRRLRHRRLAHRSVVHPDGRRALGVRGAVHRAAVTAGEPGRRARLQRRAAGAGVEPDWRRSRARRMPSSLMQPDKRGIQPRLGVAWRPIPGSSLVVRAGYGIYRNTNVYQSIATLLAQQPPLSTSFSVANSAGESADAGQRLRRTRRLASATPSRSIRTSASATRRTGRRRCSATCRRR